MRWRRRRSRSPRTRPSASAEPTAAAAIGFTPGLERADPGAAHREQSAAASAQGRRDEDEVGPLAPAHRRGDTGAAAVARRDPHIVCSPTPDCGLRKRGRCGCGHVGDRTLTVHAPKTRCDRSELRSVRLPASLARDLREWRMTCGPASSRCCFHEGRSAIYVAPARALGGGLGRRACDRGAGRGAEDQRRGRVPGGHGASPRAAPGRA